MTNSSIFLVTYNDGDYYTRNAETLAAFSSRIEASDFVLAYLAFSAERFGESIDGVSIVEMVGSETVSSLDIAVNMGVDRSVALYPVLYDLGAFYRGLERALTA